MFGLINAIGKVFSTVTSGIARVGKAVLGVGATVFTAGAASGAAPMASGGLSGLVQKFVGGGVLGNVLTGAITSAGYGALIGGAVSALTGGDFGEGALMGGLGGALAGGLAGAQGINLDPFAGGQASSTGVQPSSSTPTGTVSTGSTSPAITGAPTPDTASLRVAQAAGTPTIYTPEGGFGAPVQSGGGLGQFLSSETGGALVQGLGSGLGNYLTTKSAADERQKDRDYLVNRDQKITDSYAVGPEALHGPAQTTTGNPTPAEAYGRGTPRYRYDPEQGRVVYG